ncbi:MAG: ubiquinone/menaquinone biosynthesis methyltransferase [Candidatus Electrothrix aestuarii]|uniref:Demethylmenaquinone methyltransferase n=1 Tax=Candidatus Electrothrix aestuarii TaxID=3062594 RepID=A0AAU8LQD0_9BACT|nr:ubiquinone/menaquinone biosynthesis methyltransferase [Candidatus Electrothrix aestuarii]
MINKSCSLAPSSDLCILTASQDERKEHVRRTFASISHRYDFLNGLLSLLLDRCWRRRTARSLRDIPEGPVLDLCAGTLSMSRELARQAPDRHIYALDFCENMLKAGVKKLEDDPYLSRIFPICGDGEAIPAGGNIFSGCTVAFGLRNLVNRRQGLAEIHRVLRPGGRLLILEFSRPTNRLFKPFYTYYLHHIMPCIAGVCAENREAYKYLAQSIALFYEPEELLTMMREAGFTAVERKQLTLGIVSIYRGIKPPGGR